MRRWSCIHVLGLLLLVAGGCKPDPTPPRLARDGGSAHDAGSADAETVDAQTGDAETGGDCPLSVTLIHSSTVVPAAVVVEFNVSSCGEPVPGLMLGSDLTILNDETSQPFRSEGTGAVATAQVSKNVVVSILLLLDMSYSITQTPGRLDNVIAGARGLIQELLVGLPAGTAKPAFGIYVFGSTVESGLFVDFTTDAALLEAALDILASDPGRGSTNLYGAYLAGMDLLDRREDAADAAQIPGEPEIVSSEAMVLLTDGVHETGNGAVLRQNALAVRSRHRVYAIPIKDSTDEYDVEAVCELATAGQCYESQADRVAKDFGVVAERLDALAKSNYVVAVCSPLEIPDASLTVEVIRDGHRGALQVPYNASSFVLKGCDVANVLTEFNARACPPGPEMICGEPCASDCGCPQCEIGFIRQEFRGPDPTATYECIDPGCWNILP